MSVIQPYPLDDAGSAGKFLQQALEGRERLFIQLDAAMKEMRATRDASRFLYVRFGMLEYMAAAYATKDRRAFDAALDSLLAHPLPDSARAAQLGADLAAALCSGRRTRTGEIAARVMRSEVFDTPEDLQAQALSMLAVGAGNRALPVLSQLRDAVAAANLPACDAGLLRTWANAAEALAARNATGLAQAIEETMRMRALYANKMLDRWRKGHDTQLTAIDFWDS